MLDDLDTIQNFLNPEFIEIRGGNSCSRVGFVSCQVMSIR